MSIETTRPTTYDARPYVEEGVRHFCVTNMPGSVPRTAAPGLTAAMLPCLVVLLTLHWRDDSRLANAIDVEQGRIVHPALM